MGSNEFDKIDEVADGVDELQHIVEELEDDPPSGVKPDTLKKLDRTLDEARDTADALEEERK